MGRIHRLKLLFTTLLLTYPVIGFAQDVAETSESEMRQRLLQPPTEKEILTVLDGLRRTDLSPRDVKNHASFPLANGNRLSIISHSVEGQKHFGAIIVPKRPTKQKLPVVIMACGGDGMSIDFDITKDFTHEAVQFPDYLGGGLDSQFVVVIPSFRGQKLIYQEQQYLSEGNVGDAFDGATTDALALLNVVLETVDVADKERIAICGGSRGGTVALLAAARDKRIKKAVVIAAPTNMKGLYLLYPEQFDLLFFKDLLAGSISEKKARRRFIASSPKHFADELPSIQIHHDQHDPFVPIEFAYRLVKRLKDNNQQVDPHYYQEEIHGFWKSPEFWIAVQAFLNFE